MKSTENIKIDLLVFSVFVLISYPLFYYAYKYCSPQVGQLTDYYSYYNLYDKWDFGKVESPFNIRLISSFFVFLFGKLNFYYDTQIAFNMGSQKIFFDAIFLNYIFVVLTCMAIFKTVYHFFSNYLFAFGISVLYLLGFGTIFFELSPITDSCSVFLMAVIFYFYLRQSKWVLLFLSLAVFQREYILLAMGLL